MKTETVLDAIDQLNGALCATDEVENQIDDLSIGRLVAAGKIAPAAKKDVQKVVNASVKRRLLTSTLTRDQRFLMSQTGKLPIDNKVDIASGKAQFTLMDKYLRKQLAGGNQQELVLSAENDEVGLKNFDGNALANGENMVVSGIKLSYAYSASSTDPKAQIYTNAMDAETAGSSPLAVPAAFINGEIEFRVEGTSVLRLPVKKFFRESLSVGVGVEGGADTVQLPSPILLKARQAFSIVIHGANGVALPANNHFVEVRLMGSGIIGRR